MADIDGEYLELQSFEDLPDFQWDAAVINFEHYEDLPDFQWGAAVLNEGGSVTHTYWLMRALTDPAGSVIYWKSIDEPDYSGSSAPEPVQTSTINLICEVG